MSTSKAININVSNVMINREYCPKVGVNDSIKECLEQMEDFNLGIVNIIDNNGLLVGILTEGDLRRLLLKVQKPFSALLSEDIYKYSNNNPLTVSLDTSLFDAIKLMGEKKIWDLPVIDKNNQFVGLLHLHPAIEKLIKLID